MSLAMRLAKPPTRATGGRSVLDVWLEGLDAEDHEAVVTALRDPAWRHVDLQAELEAEGAPEVADTTFGTWRRKKGYRA